MNDKNTMGEFLISFFANNLVKSIISIITSLCIPLIGFFWDRLKEQQWAPVIVLIPYLLLLLIFIVQLFKRKKGSDSEKLLLPENLSLTDLKRYSIVIIDDDSSLRTTYSSLRQYNVSILDKIDSELYLYGFDIVIIDLVNIVSFNPKSSIDIIKALKMCKPYKYIIAISTDPNELNNCIKWSDAIIIKADRNEETLNMVKDGIEASFEVLDHPSKYWEKLKGKEFFRSELEDLYKSDYLNTIKHKHPTL